MSFFFSKRLILPVLLGFLLSNVVLAAGPLNVSSSGVPSAWNNETSVKYHPEDGSCGPFNNAQILSKFDTLMQVWTELDEVDLSMTQVTGQLGQVGVDNYENFLYLSTDDDEDNLTDNINPIIFDDDAAIIGEVAGEANQFLILGFAGPTAFDDDKTTINDGQAVINCRCIEGDSRSPCTVSGVTITVSQSELDFTIVHEMGHFLNLGHSNLNNNLFDNGDSADDVDIPIMFPVSFNSEGSITARMDDIVSIGSIYPSDDLNANYCTITGDLVDTNNAALMCADVWAVASDVADSVSSTSGDYRVAVDGNSDGDEVDDEECSSQCGRIRFRLQPGQSYTLSVNSISSSFVGGSSVGPCTNGQITVTEEDLFTIDSDVCIGGTSFNVGTLQTQSSGGVTSGTEDDSNDGSSSSGGSTGTNNSDPNLNPVGHCGLNPDGVRAFDWIGFFLVFGVFVLVRERKKFLT